MVFTLPSKSFGSCLISIVCFASHVHVSKACSLQALTGLSLAQGLHTCSRYHYKLPNLYNSLLYGSSHKVSSQPVLPLHQICLSVNYRTGVNPEMSCPASAYSINIHVQPPCNTVTNLKSVHQLQKLIPQTAYRCCAERKI